MDLELSSHALAALVSRMAKTSLSPLAKSAAKHEPVVNRLLLDAIKVARVSVNMNELQDVLILGHPGVGAPLYVVEPALQTIFAELFDGLTDDLLGTISHRSFLRELKRPKKKLPGALSDAVKDGAKAGASHVTWSAEIIFDAVNVDAVAWAEQHAAELVANIASDSRIAIRIIVSESFDGGMSTREQARLIRAVIGLTDRDAGAVMKQQLKWLSEGINASRATSRAERYANKLLRTRAMTIARTETMRASIEGQRSLWQRAREKGLLSADAKKVWIAYDPCPLCSGVAGEEVLVDGEFSVGTDPPLHPNCRCVTGLV